MSDTPETDAASQSWLRIRTNSETFIDENKIVPADFTRNLERQRNEALQLARELRDALENIVSVGTEFYDMDMGDNGSEAIEQSNAALTKANQLLK